MDADAKLSRWSNLSTMAGVVITALGALVGWMLSIPWQLGLFIGLVAWALLSNGAITLGRREVRKEESAAADEVERLTSRLSEAEQERDELRAEIGRLNSQADEGLTERARVLSEELFRVGKERDQGDPQHRPDYPAWIPQDQEQHDLTAAKTRYDDETWSLYRQQYEGEVRAVLSTLERRGLCDDEERKEI